MKDRHRHLTKGTHDKHHEESGYAAPGNLSHPRWLHGARPQHRIPAIVMGILALAADVLILIGK